MVARRASHRLGTTLKEVLTAAIGGSSGKILWSVVAVPLSNQPRPGEPLVQFSFSMRRSLRRELDRLAADSDMTMRSFVLSAL